jgi:hypothetical protein
MKLARTVLAIARSPTHSSAYVTTGACDGGSAMLPYGFAVSTARGLLAFVLFDPGAGSAQEVKQIKLTERHVQNFIAAHEEMTKLYEGVDPEKPDPKLTAQAEAIAKKNGFVRLDEHAIVTMNILMVMSGIDPQTKQFTEPPEQIRRQIAALKEDKFVPETEKKQVLAQLEAALKNTRPIQFKENIALVLKYFDKLAPLMQEQGPAD